MRTFTGKPTPTQEAKPAGATKLCHSMQSGGALSPLRSLQDKPDELKGGSGATATRLGHNFNRVPVFLNAPSTVQTKLTVNAPGDAYEQEADRVADRIMSMPESAAAESAGHSAPTQIPQVQRACAKCEGEEEEEETEEKMIQRKETHGTSLPVNSTSEAQIESLTGGVPLPAHTRTFFEPRFGYDFSQVRIHTDAAAARSARAVNARAYTLGNDVVFETGQYAPETAEGKRLLAHELTHVVQQGRSGSSQNSPVASQLSRRVQRTTFPDCTPAQLPSLGAAVAQADADLGAAIAKLTTRPLTTDVQDALWLAFRTNTEATADRVKNGLTAIKSGLPSVAIECEQPGDTGYDFFCTTDAAYVRSVSAMLGVGNIHLCMGHWPGNAIDGGRLIIHEGSHRFDNTGDEGYFSACAESAQTAGLIPIRRLDNADSYSCFVNYAVHYSAARLAAHVAEYHGSTLNLVQTPPGAISLSGANVRDPLFSMQGIPQSSGFQCRWVIADSNDNRYLMRSDARDPFQFGPCTQTYIGARTRELLRSSGITAANVLCRVMMPEAGDRLFTLPVQFTP